MLSDDGNVLDAAALAADAALRDARLPAVCWDPDAGVAYLAPDQPAVPVVSRSSKLDVMTVALFNGTRLVDPDSFEEDLCTASATVATDINGRLRFVSQVGAGDLLAR